MTLPGALAPASDHHDDRPSSARSQPGERQRSALERHLEDRSAGELLAWASRHFGTRIGLATGFGVEGCVLIDLVARRRLAIEVFTLDTGLFFPETYALWRRLEALYGLTIRAVRPALDLEAQAHRHGARLWERDPDRCCEIRKVAPLGQALSGFDAWITAVRRDQTAARRVRRAVEWDERFGLVKVNPLLNWTSEQVWRYVREHGVPCNRLHDEGYPSIGCWPCTTPVGAGEDPRAGR